MIDRAIIFCNLIQKLLLSLKICGNQMENIPPKMKTKAYSITVIAFTIVTLPREIA